MRKQATLYFLLYLFFNAALALFIHKDIIFNTHNFGRHWDWSLYAKPELYENYFKTFLYAIKPNYHGYYDILSINFAEIFFKGGIYCTYRLFFGLIPISILNKIAVFVILPLVSSTGIWVLGNSILKRKSTDTKQLHTSILLIANILYTFSLLLIFDIHGGALNRQISSVIFPFFWTLLYVYYSARGGDDTRTLPLLALLFLFFDISNIFYFAVTSAIVIFFKKTQSFKKKLLHYTILGVSAVLIHAFWIQAFFIGNQLTLGSILYGRSPNYAILEPYSATFSQLLLNIKTPHDLIEGIYRYSPFLIVSFLVIFGGILYALRQDRWSTQQRQTLKVFFLCYFFSTSLTLGTHSIFSIHKHLYETGMFAFVGGALRFAPNTLSASIMLFLLASSTFFTASKIHQRDIMRSLQIAIGVLLLSYLFNGSFVERILSTYPPAAGVNNEVGALYDYPNEPMHTIQKERLIYTVLPIPSWYSPIYTDNVFPKTSQGSLVDSFFLNKTMLYTNTTPLFSSNYFHAAINYPNDLFMSFSNVGRVIPLNEAVAPGLEEYSFSKQWMRRAGIDQSNRESPFYNHPNFYPHVYSPDSISLINTPLELMYTQIQRSPNLGNTQAAALLAQIPKHIAQGIESKQWKSAHLEYKRIDTTGYFIVAHDVSEPFYVTVADSYHPDWKASVITIKPHTRTPSTASSLAKRYYSFPGNEATQTSAKSLATYLSEGLLSPIPDGEQQLDYVSKQYHNSIQNDMLDFDTYQPLTQINDANHFKINGFANAWLIDPKQLCARSDTPCKKTQDIVIWVQFTPQIAYRYALLVSCTSILMLIAFSFYLSQVARHEDDQ